MFVFGWGKKLKGLGTAPVGECVRCRNVARPSIVERVGYFSLFFIPVISRSRFFEICPICHNGLELGSREAARGRLVEARMQDALPIQSVFKSEEKPVRQCLHCGLLNEVDAHECRKCSAALPHALPALSS